MALLADGVWVTTAPDGGRARLGELVTRLGQVSTELTVHIALDTSASMNWGDPNKLHYAKRLAAALD